MKKLLRSIYFQYLHKVRGLPHSLGESFAAEKLDDETNRWLVAEPRNEGKRIQINEEYDALVRYWPSPTIAAFNLNFDDLCPLYSEISNVDFGGAPDRGVNQIMVGVFNDFPELKVTHFVIPHADSRFCGSTRIDSGIDLFLTAGENSSWLEWLRGEVTKSRIEIACHGYSHYNAGVLARQHAEFAFCTRKQSQKRIKRSLETFSQAGLNVVGFRQPGWDLAADFSLLDEVKKMGFEYIGGSSPDAGLNYGSQRVSNLLPSHFRSILNVPQNVGLADRLPLLLRAAEEIVKRGGLVSLKGHYTNLRGIPNRITDETILSLRKVLIFLRREYAGKIWYATLKDITRRWAGIENVTVEQSHNKCMFVVRNTTQNDLPNVAVELKQRQQNTVTLLHEIVSLRANSNEAIALERNQIL